MTLSHLVVPAGQRTTTGRDCLKPQVSELTKAWDAVRDASKHIRSKGVQRADKSRKRWAETPTSDGIAGISAATGCCYSILATITPGPPTTRVSCLPTFPGVSPLLSSRASLLPLLLTMSLSYSCLLSYSPSPLFRLFSFAAAPSIHYVVGLTLRLVLNPRKTSYNTSPSISLFTSCFCCCCCYCRCCYCFCCRCRCSSLSLSLSLVATPSRCYTSSLAAWSCCVVAMPASGRGAVVCVYCQRGGDAVAARVARRGVHRRACLRSIVLPPRRLGAVDRR